MPLGRALSPKYTAIARPGAWIMFSPKEPHSREAPQ
uniref:Uncharacterized protein n=1 Tax=Arundo donax TaxID=35708 RepID=A0A0A9B915_ARUDO